MAIVQISKITNRRGLQQDLPQLAPGELGWCLDSRLLFIGNGTLEEGSPAIGNTEVLTEFSDIRRFIEGVGGPFQLAIANIVTLNNNTAIFTDSGFSFPNNASALFFEYQIERNFRKRIGVMTISFSTAGISYSDNYVEPEDMGVELKPQLSLGVNKIFYTTTAIGGDAVLSGSVRYFTEAE